MNPLTGFETLEVWYVGPLPIEFASFACRPSDKFARLRSVPGMWAFAPGHNHSYSPDPAVAQRQRLAELHALVRSSERSSQLR